MERVWVVLVETYDDEGHLISVEVIAYASEQTARQHAERDDLHVSSVPVLTKLRQY